MTAVTPVVGYPVHALAKFDRWSNQYGATFTDWQAQCGITGTESGDHTFTLAGSARKLELCSMCFPGRSHNGCKDVKPIEGPVFNRK